jgi:hypothetical protein
MTPAAEELIKRVVDKAPPLNPRQRLQLAVLLRPDLPVGIRRAPAQTKA